MDSTLFANLPSDIIFNILCRLPVKTIIICKCVCKSWLEMLETPEFAKHHLSLSVPSLIICGDRKDRDPPVDEDRLVFKLWEFVDELELENHELHYNLVAELSRGGFNSPFRNQIIMHGSVDGLLLLSQWSSSYTYDIFHICNPITREYIKLPDPEMVYTYVHIVTFGFGVSKTSGQYKVVRILQEYGPNYYNGLFESITKTDCKVYTLGTGSWRSVAPASASSYQSIRSSIVSGAFFNGNLHWLVNGINESLWISCFDLETELFNIFSDPILPGIIPMEIQLVVLSEDYLHLCYDNGDQIFIWVMMEYGVNKSWRQILKFDKIVSNIVLYDHLFVYPIKVFKNGDILMSWNDFDDCFCFYSNQSKSLEKYYFPHGAYCSGVRLHVSSFVSLKCFAMETVSKF